MSNLSDIARRTQHTEGKAPTDERTSFMNLQKARSTDTLTEKLRNSQQVQPAEHARGIDQLIGGLVDLLPKPDGVWPIEERVKWLRLAAGIFDLGYKTGDGEVREISIVPVEK
jgi:hypothetical protein